ncbi:MAG TPA: UbiA family prenyltransferase [Planctomycetota bacterium]|nr:UbiA family prenyltransferase [Planctomycetota bacterium]
MLRVRPYLDLTRAFLAPTAVADVLAGWAIGLSARTWSSGDAPAVTGEATRDLIVAAASSVLLYSFGMAANDVLDAAKDRARGAPRPIVRGEIERGRATVVAAALGALGLLASALADALLPALAIVVLALAYNAGGKRVPLAGNVLIGGCRATNLLLGASAAIGSAAVFSTNGDMNARPILIAAATFGLYITIVTAVSVLEDREPSSRAVRGSLRAALVLFAAFPLALAWLRPDRELAWANAALLLFVLVRAWRHLGSNEARVHPASVVVRAALSAIYLIDAALVLAFVPADDLARAIAVALWLLACAGWLVKRLWLQSGRPDT